jgi:hypothetical protein
MRGERSRLVVCARVFTFFKTSPTLSGPSAPRPFAGMGARSRVGGQGRLQCSPGQELDARLRQSCGHSAGAPPPHPCRLPHGHLQPPLLCSMCGSAPANRRRQARSSPPPRPLILPLASPPPLNPLLLISKQPPLLPVLLPMLSCGSVRFSPPALPRLPSSGGIAGTQSTAMRFAPAHHQPTP